MAGQSLSLDRALRQHTTPAAANVQRAASLSNRRGVPFPTLKVSTLRSGGDSSAVGQSVATPTVGAASEAAPTGPGRQADNGQILPGSPSLPAEIQPFLFLGGEQHANNVQMLDDAGITAILNVAAECERKRFEERFEYLQLPISDHFDEDIVRYFTQAFEFIDRVRDADGKVLVHCSAGKSRSPTIIMAYLITRNRWTLSHAYNFVTERRKICPNLGFVWFLAEFQKGTIGGNPEETLQELCRASVPLEFNVLVALGDAADADAVAQQLTRLGHKYDVVDATDAVLEHAKQGRYDVIMLQWSAAALEAARRIRDLEDSGDLKNRASLIAIVPEGADEQEIDGILPSQAPFDAHVEAPVQPDALEAALGRPIVGSKRRNSL